MIIKLDHTNTSSMSQKRRKTVVMQNIWAFRLTCEICTCCHINHTIGCLKGMPWCKKCHALLKLCDFSRYGRKKGALKKNLSFHLFSIDLLFPILHSPNLNSPLVDDYSPLIDDIHVSSNLLNKIMNFIFKWDASSNVLAKHIQHFDYLLYLSRQPCIAIIDCKHKSMV